MPTCGEQDSVPSRAEVVAERLLLASIGYWLLPEPTPQLSVSEHLFHFAHSFVNQAILKTLVGELTCDQHSFKRRQLEPEVPYSSRLINHCVCFLGHPSVSPPHLLFLPLLLLPLPSSPPPPSSSSSSASPSLPSPLPPSLCSTSSPFPSRSPTVISSLGVSPSALRTVLLLNLAADFARQEAE